MVVQAQNYGNFFCFNTIKTKTEKRFAIKHTEKRRMVKVLLF